MIRHLLAFAILLASASLAHAEVRFQRLTVPDPLGSPIEVGVWAPDHGANLPLVVMSHGTGGALESHADTAKALAEAGFAAAALSHPGDNWRDLSRQGRIWERPGQFIRVVDYLLDEWPGRAMLDPDRVGAFGFSAGGFTVLAAAGGQPGLRQTRPHCQAHPGNFDCRLIARTGASAPATRRGRTMRGSRPWSSPPRPSASPSTAPAWPRSASRCSCGAPRTT